MRSMKFFYYHVKLIVVLPLTLQNFWNELRLSICREIKQNQ